jgi:hypothetical protein
MHAGVNSNTKLTAAFPKKSTEFDPLESPPSLEAPSLRPRLDFLAQS